MHVMTCLHCYADKHSNALLLPVANGIPKDCSNVFHQLKLATESTLSPFIIIDDRYIILRVIRYVKRYVARNCIDTS